MAGDLFAFTIVGLITGAALGAGIGLYRRARYYKGG